MSRSESKKRKRMTCVDYKQFKKKRKDTTISNAPSSSPNNIPNDISNQYNLTESDEVLSTYIDNLYSSIEPISNSSPYIVTPVSKGIDIETFRLPFIKACVPYPNLCNTISRSVSSSFECYPQTTVRDCSMSCPSNNDDHHITPLQLMNKSCCLVDDFIQLKSGTEITLMIPLFSSHVKHILRCVHVSSDKHNIQFGTDRTKKYLMFEGHVRSNNNYHHIKSNTISRIDVIKAFKVGRDNGYGLTVTVRQVMFGNKVYTNTSSPMYKDVLIKWLDVLVGRRSGIQVWPNLSYLRDYSKNLKYNPNEEKSLDAMNLISGFIFDELYMDKISMIHFLTKYYMVINQKNKVLIDNLKNQRS